MATPTVYVICDQNCKFEGMTKEQILTAITQAVNEGTIGDIDTGFVTTIKTINGTALKFFVGEQAAYDELTDEEKTNLFAIITNDTTKEGLLQAIEELQTATEANAADIQANAADIQANAEFIQAVSEFAKDTADEISTHKYHDFFSLYACARVQITAGEGRLPEADAEKFKRACCFMIFYEDNNYADNSAVHTGVYFIANDINTDDAPQPSHSVYRYNGICGSYKVTYSTVATFSDDNISLYKDGSLASSVNGTLHLVKIGVFG